MCVSVIKASYPTSQTFLYWSQSPKFCYCFTSPGFRLVVTANTMLNSLPLHFYYSSITEVFTHWRSNSGTLLHRSLINTPNCFEGYLTTVTSWRHLTVEAEKTAKTMALSVPWGLSWRRQMSHCVELWQPGTCFLYCHYITYEFLHITSLIGQVCFFIIEMTSI